MAVRLDWQKFPRVRCEVADASELLEAKQPLTSDQWAAMVWRWTGYPTAYVTDVLTDAGSREKRIGIAHMNGKTSYQRPSVLAAKGGTWETASKGNMESWIKLLADDTDRDCALRALKGLRDEDTASKTPTFVQPEGGFARLRLVGAQEEGGV